MNLREIQEDQKKWVLHNFGVRPSWQPFVGMVEEVGELEASIWEISLESMHDAIGDIVIFMSDFCTLEGFDLQSLYESAQDFAINTTPWSDSIPKCLAWVARGFLKKTQGVRGTPEENRAKMVEGMRGILAHLDLILIARHREPRDLPGVVSEIWMEVRKRDWRLYPETGVPPSQEPSGRVSEPPLDSGAFKGEDVT